MVLDGGGRVREYGSHAPATSHGGCGVFVLAADVIVIRVGHHSGG